MSQLLSEHLCCGENKQVNKQMKNASEALTPLGGYDVQPSSA